MMLNSKGETPVLTAAPHMYRVQHNTAQSHRINRCWNSPWRTRPSQNLVHQLWLNGPQHFSPYFLHPSTHSQLGGQAVRKDMLLSGQVGVVIRHWTWCLPPQGRQDERRADDTRTTHSLPLIQEHTHTYSRLETQKEGRSNIAPSAVKKRPYNIQTGSSLLIRHRPQLSSTPYQYHLLL